MKLVVTTDFKPTRFSFHSLRKVQAFFANPHTTKKKKKVE